MKKTIFAPSTSKCLYFFCIFTLSIFFICTPCAAYPRLEKDLIEDSCGDNDNATYVLIAYDTIHGSTAEVAGFIGEFLCDLGLKADVRLAVNVTDISKYDAVIIGTGIYEFAWLEGAKNFLSENKDALSQVDTAYFMLGISMYYDIPETRGPAKENFMDPILEEFPEVVPLSLGLFGGDVDFEENDYELFEWFILRIIGLPALLGYGKEGADRRSWGAIRIWTKDFVSKIESAN